MQVPMSNLPGELIGELRQRKWLSFVIFMIVSGLVLMVGLVWPEKYKSSTTIFADDQNIIRPLMEGSAVTTDIDDRAGAAEETLFSRRVLMELVVDTGIWGDSVQNIDAQEQKLAQLRNTVSVNNRGKNYFAIEYKDSDPVRTFRVTQKLGQLFIQETENVKKEESRSAYSFVDKQVKSYQEQLRISDENLKRFLSANVDGTEDAVNQRLSRLRAQIEETELEEKELLTQQKSLRSQLKGISKTVKKESVGSAITLRVDELQRRLDALRLNYHDSYPDIVVLKKQIADLKDAVTEESEQSTSSRDQSQLLVNPLYQELESELSKTVTRLKTIETRHYSLSQLLEKEHTRMQRIQTNKAKLSELNRDSEVNRGIYNDLLKRREKARVSMHLDIEGQGLNYKIHEPADFPLRPIGLKFIHFAVAGLLLGLLAPISLLVAYLQVDPRIRVASVLEENTGIHVLTTIPHLSRPIEHRQNRTKTIMIGLLGLVVVAVYITVTWAKLTGKINL